MAEILTPVDGIIGPYERWYTIRLKRKSIPIQGILTQSRPSISVPDPSTNTLFRLQADFIDRSYVSCAGVVYQAWGLHRLFWQEPVGGNTGYVTDSPVSLDPASLLEYPEVTITNNFDGTITISDVWIDEVSGKVYTTAEPPFTCQLFDYGNQPVSDPGNDFNIGFESSTVNDFITVSDDWEYVFLEADVLPECEPDIYCEYTDDKYSFPGKVVSDLSGLSTGGYFTAYGWNFDKLNPKTMWLCSDDCLLPDSDCVILKTDDGKLFLTRCARINYGKIPEKCDDPYYRLYRYLKHGLASDNPKSLKPVSLGTIISSTESQAVTKTTIGQLNLPNDYGSIIPVGTEVVVYNPDKQNNFTTVLGPSGPLV